MNGGTAETSTIWAIRPVPWRPHISTHLAATGGEADRCRVVQVEMFE